VSLPALESVRTDDFEVWAASPNVPLVRFAPARAISSTGLDLLGITDPPPLLIERLRSFDSIVSWYGANRPEFRHEVARLHLPFTFLPALPAAGADTHATDFYLGQVRPFATRESDGIPRVPCPAAPPENYAVIHPFSGSPRKNWPLGKFRALAARLERVMPVRWCRGEDDPPLEGAVPIPDLYELACRLARARLYIGNDSGITHLAAAAGTPVLAIFGPASDPAVWAPRGPNVRIAPWGLPYD